MSFLKRKEFFGNIGFLLPIIIIFSSLKTFGYVTTFFFYIPYLINSRHKIIEGLKGSNSSGKTVLLFFTFIFFTIIHGTYFIKDIRIIIFWLPLVFVTLGCYFKNIYDINNNNYYKNNYLKVIYKSCLIYFIFYFIMNIVAYIKYGQLYRLQDYVWIGSSGAFAISSILFYAMSKLWEKINFKIFSSFSLIFLFYIFLVLLNESRLGMFYISSFLIYLIIKNIQFKQYLNTFLITLIVLLSYSTSSILIAQFHFKFSNNYGFTPSKIERNLIKDQVLYFNQKDGRVVAILDGINKFKEYPNLIKIIGTGWYSSRVTLNQDKADIRSGDYRNSKITWPPAIVAYPLDTGLLGIVFSFYILFVNLKIILKSKEELINKLFLAFLFGIMILNVFIGYPLVNIAYLLFLMPDGIIQLREQSRDFSKKKYSLFSK